MRAFARVPAVIAASFVERARAQRAEITQYFDDLNHWNRLHPDEPIDGDPDGEMRRLASWLDQRIAEGTQ